MRKLKLLLASVALLFGGGISVWAQTDVTSTYITNPSFESDGAKSESTSSNNITGWTFAAYADKTVVGASNGGNIGWITGVSAKDGSCFVAIRHRWESNQRESNFTQEITIPKGKYTLSVDYQAYRNGDTSPRFLFSVNANGGALATASGEFAAKNNTTFNDAINKSMSLNFEAFTAKNTIKFNILAKQNIQVALDNVRLFYNGNYTSELSSAIASAQILYTRTSDAALNTAITHAEGVLSAADNTIAYQTTIDDEVTALKSAISTAYASVTLLTGENVSFLLENSDFESGSAVTGGICTYDYDCTANNTQTSQMAAVEGWTIVSNGNGKATGVVAFGSDTFLGGSGYKPTSVTSSNGESKALGIVSVWSATAQYKQNVTLPAGRYVINVPVYNLVGGTTAFTKNLIGFIEDGGTEHLASAKTYTVGNWTNETIEFDLNAETSGYMSLGYQAAGKGSGDMPHLLIDNVTITYTSAANAYAATKSAAQTTYDDATYGNVTGEEKTALYNLLNPATAPSTVSEYFTAVDNINAAVATFKAAKLNYDEYYYENLTATRLGTDVSGVTAVTSAETALTAAHEINVLNYAKVESLGYTDYASTIFGSWTDTNVNGNQTSQHWDGTSTTYFEQNNGYWSSDPWSMSRTQTITLPAGSYVLKAAARSKSTCDATMSVAIEGGSTYTTNAGHHGDSGKGITTAGVASYDEGEFANTNGRGWEWMYIPFTLASQSNVTITFSGSCAGVINAYMGFASVQFLTTEDAVKGAQLIQITDALATVPSGHMNATVKSTLDTKVVAAEAASVSNTQEELNTILTELNEAIVSATTSIAEYTKISDYLTATNTGDFAGDYSTISAAITAGSYTNSVDGIVAIKSVRNGIFTSGMTANKDLTSLIDNPSFETVPDVSWTVNPSSDTGIKTDGVDGYTLSNIDGTHFFSTWWQGRPISQNIGTLQAGVYELRGVVSSDGGTVYITMNDKHEAYVETGQYKTGTDDEKNKTKEIGIEFNYVFTLDADQEVTIGIVGGANGNQGAHKDYSADGYWSYRVDNFRLKYLGATDPTVSLDGKYVIKTGGNKISRGTNEATEAKMALIGIPVQITTDKAGISTLKFTDNDKYLFWNDENVYTDGTIDPAQKYHKPYWRLIEVGGGYNILNTETGLYLTTADVERSEVNYTILTLSEIPAVWTLEDYQVDEKKAELAAAIAAAPATPTYNVGTEAFKISQTQVGALTSAKTDGQTVYEDADATLSEVTDAISAFEGIDVVTLNVPSEDDAYNLYLADGGENYAKTVTFKNGNATSGTYAIGLTEDAGSAFNQAVYFKATATTNQYNLYIKAADGTKHYICTGAGGGYGGNNNQIRMTTDDTKALAILIVASSTEEGVYNLKNTAASNALIGTSDGGFYTTTKYNKFNINEATKNSVDVKISAAGIGTTILPFEADIPENFDAYTVDGVGGENILTLTKVTTGKFAANTPYLIAGSEGTYKLEGYGVAKTATYTEGLLTGVYTATAAPVGSYVLQKNNDVVAFYKVAEGKQPTVGANRCYLTAPAEARALYFDFGGETTGVDTIKALTSGKTTIYNAAGAVVPSLQKGLNIIKMSDGSIRKVMVK